MPIRATIMAFIVLLTLPLAPARAQDEDQPKFQAFATELLDTIEAGRTIAVRPFKATELPIAAARAKAFNDDLVAALIAYSGRKHTFIRLESLRVVIAEKCELTPEKCDAAFDDALKKAGASVLIVGQVRADGEAVSLRYEAYDLTEATTLATTQRRKFKVARAGAAAAMAWDAALAAAGKYLSENTEDLRTLCRGRITFQDTRIQTAFGRYMVSKVADEVHKAAVNVLSGGGVILGDAVDDACPTGDKGGGYMLTGNYWPVGEQLSVRLALRNDLNQEVNIWNGQLARATLPEGLELQPSEEGERSGRGVALITDETSDAEAQMRARMAARLATIAVATSRSMPKAQVDDNEAARAVMAAMSDAVTYDETWERDGRTKTQGQSAWAALLRGRVRALGGALAPKVEVALANDVIVAGELLTLQVTSPTQAYIGLYAWGADDRIVRLLPVSASEPVVVRPNATLTLPRRSDPELTSGPLPDSPLNTEALIVVASAKPIDFVALAAGVPGTTVGETMSAAVPVNRFNEELRKLDQQTVSVRYVPYTVKAP
ncbi:MAG: DUF4384 domain-containing protein [Alphaproteobacteria bacterium]